MAILISAGEVAYLGSTVLELTGKDITADQFEVGLSTVWQEWPTVWMAPTLTTPGTAAITYKGISIPAHSQVFVQLLISATLPTGNPVVAGTTVDLWVRVHDNPEIKPYIISAHNQLL